MIPKNLDSVTLTDVIAESVYPVPIAIASVDIADIYVYSENIEITGTDTLAHDVLIEMQTGITPKDGWSQTINWRANLTPSGHTLTIQGTDYTALLTGAASQDFQIIYLNGAWEVSNLQTTIEANAPVLTGYAPLASPTFTGTPAAPTVTPSTDNSTKIATTGFVQAVITALGLSNYAPLANPTFTGTVVVPTISGYADNSTKAAPTSFVQNCITNLLNTISLKKILGSSTINPTVVLDTGAGTGATCTVTGNDIGFQVNLTTGTSCATSASIVTVTFGNSYTVIPLAFIQARNNAANNLAVGARPYPSEATTAITLVSGTTALTDSTAYIFNVMVIGQ